MKAAKVFNVPVDYFTTADDTLAAAMWHLYRMSPLALKRWVEFMDEQEISRSRRPDQPQ